MSKLLRQCLFAATALWGTLSLNAGDVGSVVFIHPDGTGLGHWNAARYLYAGPDGMLNWDQMDTLAAYRVHQKNWLSTSSHAGATVHAYGVKVHHDSYGLDRTEVITALSGRQMTLMEEAMASGLRVGIVNSGHIGEPGTGVFLARSETRRDINGIAVKVMESGADLIFNGGEIHLLPEGVVGKHGREGVRKDGRNLIEEAEARGYTIIFTLEELLQLPSTVDKVIGIFAAEDTYNDETEAVLAKEGLETYNPGQPRFEEMLEKALEILGSDPARRFFLVAEEEGTDNFSNKINAKGMLDAMGRADAGIGVAMDYAERYPFKNVHILVCADSDAGHPSLYVPKDPAPGYQLPETSGSGAQLDGPNGTGGKPFMAQADAFGNRYPFGIAWGTSGDFQGSDVARAHGFKSDLLGTSADNTDIYKIFYEVLFGVTLD
jgi:alkaline phosphatase